MILCVVENENCVTAPFLALIVWSFLYTGVMLVAKG